MILYCDTSALIKLLVREPGSDRMHQASSEAQAIGVCRITWAQFVIVAISQRLVEAAGRYADAFALRGYDSVQLAAAHELNLSTDLPITFASFDRRLNQAAQLLQLDVLA